MLDDGGRPVVVGAHGVPPDLVLHGGLAHPGLPERGQDLGDVPQEGAVGPEDEQPGALDALRVRVEEVGGAVQAHGGLAGAGRALHAHGGGELAADEVVLLGLDGGGDVAHGPDAGPLDLPGENAAPLLLFALAQGLVLHAGEVARVPLAAGRPAEPPPDGDALRIPGTGLVEGAGDGGAPVDDEGRGGGMLADAQPPDVVPLPTMIPGTGPGTACLPAFEIQPPEEQRRLRQFAHGLGVAPELVPEHLGVGTGRGYVRPADHPLLGPLDHAGQGGAAGVVVAAFLGEGVGCRRHAPQNNVTELNL